MLAQLCTFMPSFPLCTALKPSVESTGCFGDECCRDSSCASAPMMGCKESRGPTECFGAHMFPPTAGMCKCMAGSICASSGVCQQLGVLGKAQQALKPFGLTRLYEESVEKVTPENLLPAVTIYGLATLSAITGAAVLGLRLRKRRSGPAPVEQQEMELLADVEELTEE